MLTAIAHCCPLAAMETIRKKQHSAVTVISAVRRENLGMIMQILAKRSLDRSGNRNSRFAVRS
jgi:hypothetical protein